MACETCDHTMKALHIEEEKKIYWCSKCGTLKTKMSGDVDYIIERSFDSMRKYNRFENKEYRHGL